MNKTDFDKLGQECFEQLKVINPKGGVKEFVRLAVIFGYNANDKNFLVQEQGISGNCFFRHKWTKWKEYTENVVIKGKDSFDYRQKRTCLRCGKVQNKLIC